MDRRTTLKNLIAGAGASLWASGIFLALESCQTARDEDAWQPAILNPTQLKTLIRLADIILPKTDTVSASEVKVHHFIDLILADVLPENQKSKVLLGLDQIHQSVKDSKEKDFLSLSGDQATDYINEIDQMSYNLSEPSQNLNVDGDAYRQIKSYILMAYFTSEQGVKENLTYIPFPTPYKACTESKASFQIFVGNHM